VELQTFSSARSAFVSIKLSRQFFTEYSLVEGDFGNIRVPLKPCIAVFRNLATIESCNMIVDLNENKLIFDIEGKLGRRIYKLFLEDYDAIQPTFPRAQQNVLTFKPNLLLSLLENFAKNVEEVTLTIRSDLVRISSFIDETRCESACHRGSSVF
jgi:hypothetical protein